MRSTYHSGWVAAVLLAAPMLGAAVATLASSNPYDARWGRLLDSRFHPEGTTE